MGNSRVAVLLMFLLALSQLGLAFAGTTERVSVSSAGVEANGGTDGAASVSADGRYVAFFMWASNLVDNDTNTAWDVFVRDRQTDTTERVSVSSSGDQGNGHSINGSISAGGRYVAFASDAGNLVTDDTNGTRDVFVRDRQLGTTERVNVSTGGDQASGSSGGPAISADGRSVLFISDATNLVSIDTNGRDDLFVRNLDTGITDRVNVSSTGVEANGETHPGGISSDGRYVAFASSATSLVANDTNGRWDIFVRDRQAGTTERVSVSSSGDQADQDSSSTAISADGRFAAFVSDASDLVTDDTNGMGDIFVRDRVAGTTERVSISTAGQQADSSSSEVAISADGRFLAFVSGATNLAPGDTNSSGDIFVRDREAGVTTLVSLSSTGAQSSGDIREPAISANGRFVSFISSAADLVPDDMNNEFDVFLRDRQTFTDVPLTHWAFYHVGACAQSGIVGGYGDGTYQPAGPVPRDQMAVFVSRAIVDGDANVPAGPTEATFDDVPTGYWSYDYIECCVAKDVVQGYDAVTYGPTDLVSRDAMAVFIARACAGGDAGVPDGPATATFDDVPTGYWSYKYIEYCVDKEIVQGYAPTTYGPTGVVTRDQMAVFVTRAFGLTM